MPRRGLAERAAFVSAALGIVMGLLFLFAPIQGYCQMTITGASGSPATPGPQISGHQSLIAAQPVWPMPFVAITVWSLAPLIGYIGLRRKMAAQAAGTALILLALVRESSVLISFGAAPFFAPFVLLPLLISTAIALASGPSQGRN